MSDIVAIIGSPSHPSRSFAIVEYARPILERKGLTLSFINVRELPTKDLIFGRYNSPAILKANEQVAQAKGVIISTPVYKATYTGVLKTYLDLLSQTGLAGKVILPIATGGTLAHLLSIDYALKPLVSALGARHVLAGVYIVDKQVHWQEGNTLHLDQDVDQRLQDSLGEFGNALKWFDTLRDPASLIPEAIAS